MGATLRVLVVEDDVEMAETVALGLRRYQMAVDAVYDGLSAVERASVNDYDVSCSTATSRCSTETKSAPIWWPTAAGTEILMLTAAATTDDLVEGLGIGADDYLAKPFDFPVLAARIQALARRSQPAVPPVLRQGDLVVDTSQRRAWRAGRPLDLTPKEFAVLELLVSAQGRSVSAEELLERAWDEAADPFTQAVKVTVSRLRAKLGAPSVIETVAKSGYRI